MPEIGGAERGAVAAGAGAEHEHLAFDVDLAGVRGAAPGTGAAAGAAGGGVAAAGGADAAVLALAPDAGCDGAAVAAAESSTTIRVPSLTLSPTLTWTSLTTPAAGEGTSIVALSDSSVTSESSAATVSPGFTKTSMTGMSLKSPMSGTLTSIVPFMVPPRLRLSPLRCPRKDARASRAKPRPEGRVSERGWRPTPRRNASDTTSRRPQ